MKEKYEKEKLLYTSNTDELTGCLNRHAYETDINNSKLDKEETKRHYDEYKRLVNNYKNSQISKEYTSAVNSFLSAIKDSNNIKNRKSYTIKVGDKQYKVFAESESEAINKYIKSKKQ